MLTSLFDYLLLFKWYVISNRKYSGEKGLQEMIRMIRSLFLIIQE
jgi:hypothetical protein